MVKSGKRVRFTASEIEEFRKVGIVFHRREDPR